MLGSQIPKCLPSKNQRTDATWRSEFLSLESTDDFIPRNIFDCPCSPSKQRSCLSLDWSDHGYDY